MIKKTVCPLCDGKIKNKYTITRFEQQFQVDLCLSCKTLFQNPLPENIESLYSQGYFEGITNYSYEDERKNILSYEEVWKKRIQFLKSKISEDDTNKKYLDIGCSFGGLLNVAEKEGFKTSGVDISDYARNYCNQNTNHDVKKSVFEFQEPSFFNVISMVELIEHLQNPLDVLKHCYTIMKKDGILVIQTANFFSLQAILRGKNYHYFLPGHLFYFSSKNLIKYLKEIKFRSVELFQPVEFGLKAKLLKSKGQHGSKWYYFKWLKIIFYHALSYIKWNKFSLTASMVLYAKK